MDKNMTAASGNSQPTENRSPISTSATPSPIPTPTPAPSPALIPAPVIQNVAPGMGGRGAIYICSNCGNQYANTGVGCPFCGKN